MKPSELMKKGTRVYAKVLTGFQPEGPGTIVGWSDPFGPMVQMFAVVLDDDELGEPHWYEADELNPEA